MQVLKKRTITLHISKLAKTVSFKEGIFILYNMDFGNDMSSNKIIYMLCNIDLRYQNK